MFIHLGVIAFHTITRSLETLQVQQFNQRFWTLPDADDTEPGTNGPGYGGAYHGRSYGKR